MTSLLHTVPVLQPQPSMPKAADGELPPPVSPTAGTRAPRKIQQIEFMISLTNDPKLLKLLNRAWWKEWFHVSERKSA
jgi:hypothetical protein